MLEKRLNWRVESLVMGRMRPLPETRPLRRAARLQRPRNGHPALLTVQAWLVGGKRGSRGRLRWQRTGGKKTAIPWRECQLTQTSTRPEKGLPWQGAQYWGPNIVRNHRPEDLMAEGNLGPGPAKAPSTKGKGVRYPRNRPVPRRPRRGKRRMLTWDSKLKYNLRRKPPTNPTPEPLRSFSKGRRGRRDGWVMR